MSLASHHQQIFFSIFFFNFTLSYVNASPRLVAGGIYSFYLGWVVVVGGGGGGGGGSS